MNFNWHFVLQPHEDGPAFYPTVSTISLGSHTLLDFYYHINAAEPSPLSTNEASRHDQSQENSLERSANSSVDHGQRASDSLKIENSSNSKIYSCRKLEKGDDKKISVDKEKEKGLKKLDTEYNGNSNSIDRKGGSDCETVNKSASMTKQSDKVAALTENACDRETKDAESEEKEQTSLEKRHFLSLLLQPRSLVLVKDDMYKIHLHGIKDVSKDIITDKVANLDAIQGISVGDILDRKTRVSLTIRHVPKVIKSKLIFGKR